jgi:hypothetical protein
MTTTRTTGGAVEGFTEKRARKAGARRLTSAQLYVLRLTAERGGVWLVRSRGDTRLILKGLGLIDRDGQITAAGRVTVEAA